MNKIIDKIENTYPEGSEVVMTLAEQFRAEGIEKGIEKGREEALVKDVIKLLTKKFGILPDKLFKNRIMDNHIHLLLKSEPEALMTFMKKAYRKQIHSCFISDLFIIFRTKSAFADV